MRFPPPSPTTTAARRPAAGPARVGVMFAVLSLALLIPVAASWSPLVSADRAVVDPLHRWAVAAPGITDVSRVLSDWVWDPWTMRVLTAVAVIGVWRLGERLLAAWVAVTTALGTFLQQAMKAALDRDRPQFPDPVDSAQYAAYPSGHAMSAVVTCGLLLWLLRHFGAGRVLWAWSVTLAAVSVVGVGLTRIHLGVHWPSDVLGGWLLGAAVVALSVASYRRPSERRPARS